MRINIFKKKTTRAAGERVGLFRLSDIRKLSKKADDKVQTKGIKEKLDGPAFFAAIWLINKLVFDKLKPEVKERLYPLIDAIVDRME